LEQHSILIVDDDKEIVELIELYLSGEDLKIHKAYDGEQAIEIMRREEISLVVLDIMMPKLDGIEVLSRIRETSNIPVILVTAKTQPLERVQGLTGGADDYITKPFHPLELVARIKAQLRRYTVLNPHRDPDSCEITIKDLVINESEHTVSRNGEPIMLTPKEFGILLLLAQNRGHVYSSEQIFERVWKEQAFEQDNTVMVHIRKLREKLGDDARKPSYIHTVWGVGYKIEK